MKKHQLCQLGLIVFVSCNIFFFNLGSTRRQSKSKDDAAIVSFTGIDDVPLLLTGHAYDPGSANITRIVWQTWKTRTLPFGGRAANMHRGMRERNQNWEFRLVVDDEMDDFMRHHFNNTIIHKAYMSLIPAAARADYWRYCVLYLRGGIYLDVDANIKGVLEEDFHEATVSLEYHKWKYIQDNCLAMYRDDLKYMYPGPRAPYVTSPAIQWMLVYPRPYHPVLRQVILLGAAIILKWRHVMTDEVEVQRYLSQHRVYCLTGPALYTMGVVLNWKQDESLYNLIGHDFGGKAVAKASQEVANRLRRISSYKFQPIPLVRRAFNASSWLSLTSEEEALVDLILKPRTIDDDSQSR